MKPMMRGLPSGPRDIGDSGGAGMTWEYIHRLRDITDQKIIVKGLVTREDAELAIEHGIDAIWVSNHGDVLRGVDELLLTLYRKSLTPSLDGCPSSLTGDFGVERISSRLLGEGQLPWL